MAAIDLHGKDNLQSSQERHQGFLHVEKLKFKKWLKIAQRYYFGDI